VWGFIILMRILRVIFSFERLVGMFLLTTSVLLYYVDVKTNAGFLDFWRNKVFDTFQEIKPREIPPAAQKPVTIIDIDEQSLETIGQWPWPRTVLAQMVDNVMKMGGVLIAFDIVLPSLTG